MFGRLAFIYLLSRDVAAAVTQFSRRFGPKWHSRSSCPSCARPWYADHINDVGEDPDDIGAPADSLA